MEDITFKQDVMLFTFVMNHLQAPSLSLQGKDKIVSVLVQTIFSFLNKIKLFLRDINTKSLQHFPLLKGLVNSASDLFSENIKLFVESLDGVSTNFATRFSDLESPKTTFAFLVSAFVVDVMNDSCQVQKLIIIHTANIEAELLDLQQDFALK